MKIGKTTVSVTRFYGRPQYSATTNLGITALKRNDRRSSGITYLTLYLGHWCVDIMRTNRSYMGRVINVAERGVW